VIAVSRQQLQATLDTRDQPAVEQVWELQQFAQRLYLLFNGGETVDDIRKTLWIQTTAEYFDYILVKHTPENQLCEHYVRYLAEQDLVDAEERDDQRHADASQKEQLADECAICTVATMGYHHIVPHSAGGPTTVWNLAPLCKACHRVDERAEIGMFESFRNTPDNLEQDTRDLLTTLCNRQEFDKAKQEVQNRVADGYYHGRPPYGLRFDADKQHLEPDPDEIDTVRTVLRQRDAGASYRAIADETGLSAATCYRIVERRDLYEQHIEGDIRQHEG